VPPVRVSEDNWVLDGCPENGPAVAIDRSSVIHVVWPTLIAGASGSEPNLALFYATSHNGRDFTKRRQLPTEGTPRHPEIAIDSTGDVLIAWDEHVAGGRRVVLARGAGPDRSAGRFVRDTITGGAGSYPAIAAVRDGALVLWTSGAAGQTMLRVGRPTGATTR
jgi:hypothetical protein